ncbi:hypothetical protein ACIQU5_18980 [Streptomyces sp. NPDC090306]|uniref:hypothetical protein n=1 Tax=Streptomyces sp. NPDC090306 TaxID=3365961 RepID=UPI003825639D
MAFGTQELRVVRRALALALQPGPASAEDAQDCLALAGALDEAEREGARLRAFLVADLARYRAALPGSVTGYLALLEEVLAAGHRPDHDDLAALGALRGNPRAAALLDRCAAHERGPAAPRVPASRSRLHALPGGRTGGPQAVRTAGEASGDPDGRPAPRPSERPAPAPENPGPGRPVPTPGEVFPRRRPAPAPPAPPRQLAAV